MIEEIEKPEIDYLAIQQAPIKMMRKLNLGLCGSKHIRDDDGLTFLSITGNQQSGKSVYAMRILAEIYNYDVDKILNSIVFRIEDFAAKIKHATENNYRIPALLLDDASISMSAAQYGSTPKDVLYISKLGDSLATAIKGLIMTSPSGDLVKAFRNYNKYKIVIGKGGGTYQRIARAYKISSSPLGQKYIQHIFDDTYDIRISFYNRYAGMRKEISLMAINSGDKQDTSIVSTIQEFMIDKTEWRGTATDLLESLSGEDLPASSSSLMTEINKNKRGFKVLGITFDRTNNGKTKTIIIKTAQK